MRWTRRASLTLERHRVAGCWVTVAGGCMVAEAGAGSRANAESRARRTGVRSVPRIGKLSSVSQRITASIRVAGAVGSLQVACWCRRRAAVRSRVPRWSDRPNALRRSALLRTGPAALAASGSSRSRGLGGGQSSGPCAVSAVGVYETVISLVGRGVRGHDRDRVAGGSEPSFPVVGGWWLLIDRQQRGLADRAAFVLGLVEPQAGAGGRRVFQ
jgi:hypothetical protein